MYEQFANGAPDSALLYHSLSTQIKLITTKRRDGGCGLVFTEKLKMTMKADDGMAARCEAEVALGLSDIFTITSSLASQGLRLQIFFYSFSLLIPEKWYLW